MQLKNIWPTAESENIFLPEEDLPENESSYNY